MSSNITPGHLRIFEALTSGKYDSFALYSCFVDGRPSVAIVNLAPDGDGMRIELLFVSVSEEMDIRDHDGERPSYNAFSAHKGKLS